MNAHGVLARVREAGGEVLADGDEVRVRVPKGRLTDELLAAVRANKQELLAVLASDDIEVRWRYEAMRPQIPRLGPLLRPKARTGCHPIGSCRSCGGPLDRWSTIQCRACIRASWLAIYHVREGVDVSVVETPEAADSDG